MPNPANTSCRKRDGTTFRSTPASVRRATADLRQVIGRLAAAVVHHHRLSEQPRDLHGRPRRQQERGVGRGEHVDDVRVRASRRTSDGPVDQLRGQVRTYLTRWRTRNGPWRLRVDRQQRGADLGVAVPGAQQPVRLHRLAAENRQRGRHQHDVKRLDPDGFACARCFRGATLQGSVRRYRRVWHVTHV